MISNHPIFMKNFIIEYSKIKLSFNDQYSNPLEIEVRVSITRIILSCKTNNAMDAKDSK